MNTPSARTEPSPETVSAGADSSNCVPDSSMDAATEGPSIRPPQRAPYPVDEIVAAPASNTPLTVMVTPSDARRDTPS